MNLNLFSRSEVPVSDPPRNIVMFNELKDVQISLQLLPLTDVFRRIPAHRSNRGVPKRIAEECRIPLRRPAANDRASDIAYVILAGSVFASLIEFCASLPTGW
jgi:hypothetical protein